ncbi:hypothetical protein Phou_012230 [Phytohabitans houttuyneae]|uniref:Uncharacterized protein n=1 Tax=Phytohabitans houttuyneae TaxID=1076126 RepID=A0A6V8JWI9_9ACTN|nr:hypothetical protein Phou_012230 [Phytohabitans houttuyneae]
MRRLRSPADSDAVTAGPGDAADSDTITTNGPSGGRWPGGYPGRLGASVRPGREPHRPRHTSHPSSQTADSDIATVHRPSGGWRPGTGIASQLGTPVHQIESTHRATPASHPVSQTGHSSAITARRPSSGR